MEPTIQQLKMALKKREHINAATSFEIPEYAIHSDTHISGFFGSYRFLSNFWPCPNGIYYLGIRFPSVEHAYQAAKCAKEKHSEIARMTASQAKKTGRMAILSPHWDNGARQILMSAFVLSKFTTDDTLKKMLLDTGDKILEERNSWGDRYWGIDENGMGRNELGKLLMTIRGLIRC